jgi:hypothetical protein
MWPFSRKSKTPASAITVAEGLERLSGLGIRVRPGITQKDLLLMLGGTVESPVDWVSLLCVLGSEVEHGQFERISDDIWHFDAECIEDDGDYARVVQRFAILAKELLPIKDLRDHVDIENETAWVEFKLDGQSVRWDLEVGDDWVDPNLYSRMQDLVEKRGGGKRFFIAALGQDSLLCFGDEVMKNRLSGLSGLEFQWE